MQDARVPSLSIQLRNAMLRPFAPAADTGDERLEDQLDRLNQSVQQVLAGASELQLEDIDLSVCGAVSARTRFRVNSDLQDCYDSEDLRLKSPLSDYEAVEDESLEIIELLATLLERSQMESEDLRSQACRILENQRSALIATERSILHTIAAAANLPVSAHSTLSSLAEDITALLRPEITCSMDQLCECENTLFELLQDHSKDAVVQLRLGMWAFALKVVRSDADVLLVGKKRLGAGIGESLKESIWDEGFSDSQAMLPVEVLADHSECERQIEELRLRLEYMKENIIPTEVYLQVEQEKQQLRRTEHIRRQEIEHLQSTRTELETLCAGLKSQIDQAKIANELLASEQMGVSELQVRLKNERTVLAEKLKSLETAKREIETEKENILTLANVQGQEVMTLKQKIERMMLREIPQCDETKSIPESLPDGDLRELDLRLKQMITLIDAEKGDVDTIQQEITDIESCLSRINPKRSGVRRITVLLTSSKNKLVGLKSKQAIAGADRMMTNINATISALEKTWKWSGKEQPKQGSADIRPLMELMTSPKAAEPMGKKIDKRGFMTPSKAIDFTSSTPATEEKEPNGRWITLTETVKNQEMVITKLKNQLNHISHKLKHMDTREQNLCEKEGMLRALEKQLEVVNSGLEKRLKAITLKEKGLKEREIALLSAADNRDYESLYSQLDSRLRALEQTLSSQTKDIDFEKGRLLALKEEITAKEKHCLRVQKSLAKENLRVEKEKKKLDVLRSELSLLLPSLTTLTKPKAF